MRTSADTTRPRIAGEDVSTDDSSGCRHFGPALVDLRALGGQHRRPTRASVGPEPKSSRSVTGNLAGEPSLQPEGAINERLRRTHASDEAPRLRH